MKHYRKTLFYSALLIALIIVWSIRELYNCMQRQNLLKNKFTGVYLLNTRSEHTSLSVEAEGKMFSLNIQFKRIARMPNPLFNGWLHMLFFHLEYN